MLPLYRGTLDAVRHIVREEGWRALYAGLTPALIGSGMAWGAYFFAYNRAKQRWHRPGSGGSGSGSSSVPAGGQMQPPKLTPVQHLISAVEAGVLVCADGRGCTSALATFASTFAAHQNLFHLAACRYAARCC